MGGGADKRDQERESFLMSLRADNLVLAHQCSLGRSLFGVTTLVNYASCLQLDFRNPALACEPIHSGA